MTIPITKVLNQYNHINMSRITNQSRDPAAAMILHSLHPADRGVTQKERVELEKLL